MNLDELIARLTKVRNDIGGEALVGLDGPGIPPEMTEITDIWFTDKWCAPCLWLGCNTSGRGQKM